MKLLGIVILVLLLASTLGVGPGMAAPILSHGQFVEAKKQLANLEQELKWELVSLKIALLMNNRHPILLHLIKQQKKQIAEIESEIVHYKSKLFEWEQQNMRRLSRSANGCAQNENRPLSAKLRQILRSTRDILAKMKWDSSVKTTDQKKALEIRQSTIHYLNQTAYLVLFKGKEIVKIFKFNNVGIKELAMGQTVIVKNGVHITYQEGNKWPATAYLAQVAYLEEIPVTDEVLLKLGPAISYQIGDPQKHVGNGKGSMAVMGPKIQLHINRRYFIAIDSGFGIRFNTSWIRDLLKKRSQGVNTASEIMFHFGMVFPG